MWVFIQCNWKNTAWKIFQLNFKKSCTALTDCLKMLLSSTIINLLENFEATLCFILTQLLQDQFILWPSSWDRRDKVIKEKCHLVQCPHTIEDISF